MNYSRIISFSLRILEHIESGRKEVEKELKECLKLYNWERSTVESFRRTRQKIWKYVKKYNVHLQLTLFFLLHILNLSFNLIAIKYLMKFLCALCRQYFAVLY